MIDSRAPGRQLADMETSAAVLRGDQRWLTIGGLLRDVSRVHGEQVAIEDGPLRLTYAELQGEVARIAKALLAHGLLSGQAVAIWAPNVAEFILVTLAAQLVGGFVVPINTRYKGEEAAFLLVRSQASILFTVRGFLGADYPALLAGRDLPALCQTVCFRTPEFSAFLVSGLSVTDADLHGRESAVGPESVSDVLFTSGTTGHPKGVPSTHAQTLRVFDEWTRVVGLRASDRYLVVPPFFHCFGYKAGWLACLMTGATIVPQAIFDVSQVLARIENDRITVLTGPPTLYQSILSSDERSRYDLTTLRLAVTGAAVIPVKLIDEMRSVLGFETVLTAYGLTECCGVATMCRQGDDAETVATTSGRAISDTEVIIARSDGTAADPGETGEVWIRGYNVMSAYLDEIEETASALDAAGFLHTGDIGLMDAAGNLRITDRLKDMFIVGGFNAYPAEIEAVLGRHDDLERVAVVGVPDGRLGEVGAAFCVLRPGVSLDADALTAWARERLANYKVPRYFRAVEALPLNASGKVLKRTLRLDFRV